MFFHSLHVTFTHSTPLPFCQRIALWWYSLAGCSIYKLLFVYWTKAFHSGRLRSGAIKIFASLKKEERGKRRHALCNLKKRKKQKTAEEIKQMKTFLHSRAPGCSVGVAIPVHEQHHWFLWLWMDLFLLVCNFLPTESPCIFFHLTAFKKDEIYLVCLSFALIFLQSKCYQLHCGTKCCISWCLRLKFEFSLLSHL